DILWRFGGKNNQFLFVNDGLGFSHQHDIRRLPAGTVTLYDNGNYHSPPFSRAVEYSLDEVEKVAVLVWEYRHVPDVFGGAMGDVQRQPNGNTLVGWGAADVTLTEVTPDGSPVYEMAFDPGVYSYRSFRFPWTPFVDVPSGLGPSALSLRNYPNPF